MKEKLTAGRINTFSCPEGSPSAFIWDAIVPGLGVRAHAGGSKKFVVESRLHGKTIRLTIGDVTTWPLDGRSSDPRTARAEARRLLSLLDQGQDPRLLAKKEKAEAERIKADVVARSTLVADAWNAYIGYHKEKMQLPHIERGKKWGIRHLEDHIALSQAGGAQKKRGNGSKKQGVLFPLMSYRLTDITSEVLKEWQRKEAKDRANNARQGFELFRTFWRWCSTRAEYSMAINLEAIGGKELRDEVPGRKTKSEDCLQREQLGAWFREVTKARPIVAAYLQVLLLTGARREEMAELRWRDVDFQWMTLRISDKVDGERVIPLTPYVSVLLRNLEHRNNTPPPEFRVLNGKRVQNDLSNWQPSEWVFSSKSASGHIEDPTSAHTRAVKTAGLPHITIHGLRRSFGTLSEWLECPAGVVAQIQGHKPSAIAEKHYRRRPIDLLRMWHEKIETWILKEAGMATGSPIGQ